MKLRLNSISVNPLIPTLVAVVAWVLSWFIGYHAGSKESPMRSEREGMIIYAVEMYRAAETTNLSKLHGFLDTEIVSMTRDYERRFGVPSGPGRFATNDFPYAKMLADKIEKQMLPIYTSLQ